MSNELRPIPVRGSAYRAPAPATAAAVSGASKVLRNTYMLLSMTLLFSAAMAGLAAAIRVPLLPFHGLILLVGMIGSMFWINATRNSAQGLVAVFAFTGFTGFMLGPFLSAYVQFIPNGGMLLMQALGGTGAIFLSLSAYALTTKKDFSFMGGFLMTGVLVLFFVSLGALIASYFGVAISGISLAISAAAMLLFSALILFDTSRIIHGGETNYIMATVALYLDIYNIFMSLLNLLGLGSSND